MTPPDISSLTGRFVLDQVLAAAVLAAALLVILVGMGLLNRRKAASGPSGISPKSQSGAVPGHLQVTGGKRWHLLVGLDNRASTSRSVALLWTMVVGFCLLTLTFVALSPVSAKTPVPAGHLPVGWISAAFQPLGTSYLVALGAPLAAALLARAIVGSRTASGAVQKSTAPSASVLDLVTDDSGDLDLVDLQYTLFNIITALFVVTQFSQHVPRGFVVIPPALATLSGLSAALYTGNKLAVSNPPRLDRILTPTVAPGGRVTLVGTNLLVGSTSDTAGSEAAGTLVSLSNAKEPSPPSFAADSVTPTQLTFTVPADTPVDEGWDVSVLTNAGGTAVLYAGLNVVAVAPSKTAKPDRGNGDETTNGARVGGIGLPLR